MPGITSGPMLSAGIEAILYLGWGREMPLDVEERAVGDILRMQSIVYSLNLQCDVE
jgi:hypothetical protein